MHNFPIMNSLPIYSFTAFDNKKKQLRQQGLDYFDFGMGNPDRSTSPEIIEEMIKHTGTKKSDGYAPSNGIPELRDAICQWYQRHYGVQLDYEKEAIVTIGSKDGLAHLALATTGPNDLVLTPDPCYPIHKYGFILAGAKIEFYKATAAENIVAEIKAALKAAPQKPKFLVLNFPSNPTAQSVELPVFEELVQLAKKEQFWILQDLAYADLTFNTDRAPSILQVPGAKEIAIESFTISKSYNMAGWRIGFMCGNEHLVGALKHLKHYLDYGSYLPLQYAAIKALTVQDDFLAENREMYRHRRDLLCANLDKIGWKVSVPNATMFIWARIPEQYRAMGSMKFAHCLLDHAHVAVSPGIAFGAHGDEYVRIALIQEDQAVEAACEMIGRMLNEKLGLE